MEIKYLEDYMDELSAMYPQIEKKELYRMMKESLTILNQYMRLDLKGFSVKSATNLSGERRLQAFEINKISNRKVRRKMSKHIKNRNKLRDAK